jgi:hypothetical protein
VVPDRAKDMGTLRSDGYDRERLASEEGGLCRKAQQKKHGFSTPALVPDCGMMKVDRSGLWRIMHYYIQQIYHKNINCLLQLHLNLI